MKGHHQGEECQHVIRGLFHGELLIKCLFGARLEYVSFYDKP